MNQEVSKKDFIEYDLSIAGNYYYSWPSNIVDGDTVNFKFEKDNEHDKNAIGVWFGKHKLGYIPKIEAQKFADKISAGWVLVEEGIIHIDCSAVKVRLSHPLALDEKYLIYKDELINIEESLKEFKLDKYNKALELNNLLVYVNKNDEAYEYAIDALKQNDIKLSNVVTRTLNFFISSYLEQKQDYASAYDYRLTNFKESKSYSDYNALIHTASKIDGFNLSYVKLIAKNVLLDSKVEFENWLKNNKKQKSNLKLITPKINEVVKDVNVYTNILLDEKIIF